MIYEEKRFYTIQDNFMFVSVFEDEKRLRELLRRVLPELDIDNLTITPERWMKEARRFKGIRMDLCSSDGKCVFVVEMQVRTKDFAPLRSKYYHSVNTVDQMKPGDVYYEDLKPTYVIIICPTDPVGDDKMVYTAVSRFEETGKRYEDGTVTKLINCSGKNREKYPELLTFCDYVTKRQESEGDPFIKEIDQRVIYLNSDPEWMKVNMDFKQHELEMKHIGKEEGIKEGRAEEKTIMIKTMYRMLRKMGLPDDQVISKIVEECPDCSEEEIHEWIRNEQCDKEAGK